MDEPNWLTADELEDWRALMALTLALPAALDRQLKQDSCLTGFEYHVLAALSESPGRSLPMSVLATLANGSMSRLSHVVARLESDGWVERRARQLAAHPALEHGRVAGHDRVGVALAVAGGLDGHALEGEDEAAVGLPHRGAPH